MATFGDWEFACDRDATIAAYSRAELGGSGTCSCNGCRNFSAARSQVFPPAFLFLLESLGIDSRKDSEVYRMAQLAPGRHVYGGWFHFVGTLDRTGDFPVVALAEGFAAWMCRRGAPALASLKELPLVQVEFQAENVPWVLNEPEPQ